MNRPSAPIVANNIHDLRAAMDLALADEGLEEKRLVPKTPKVWALAGGDIIRFFGPHGYRRPWGFVYIGVIGLELPQLREWLRRHKPREEWGIFHSAFVAHHNANDDVLGRFMLELGMAVPADLWAGLLKDRLMTLPASFEELIATYRRNRERLGGLADPCQKSAWDFLLRWREDPDPAMHVPRMEPDGRIV